MIGHEWATQLLAQHSKRGALRHAYLLVGPKGLGKQTLATRTAQMIFCEAGPDAPCRECQACRRVEAQRHPDLHVVQVEPDENNIRIEQIRTLQRSISLAPYEAERRIVLVLGAHDMSLGASNALLKTLEEPPAECVLLLTAESRESLLPTIVSRCEVLPLRLIPHQQLLQGVQAAAPDLDEVELVATLAAGRPGVALRLASEDGALEARREHVDDLLRMLAGNRRDRFAFADAVSKGGDAPQLRDEALAMLETWLGIWRTLLLVSHGAKAVTDPTLVDSARLADHLTPAQTAEAARAIERAMVGINQYANLQLTLENALLKLPYVDGLEGMADS